ncbi:zinc finger, CCHC-type containing protein [Tanacetum coccineum]
MLTPSGGGLILYQAYGNLYAMTGRKAHLLEDKQIPSVGVFDEVFSTWMAFGVNTRNLGSFREEMDKTTTLHQILEEVVHIECGDGVAEVPYDLCISMFDSLFYIYQNVESSKELWDSLEAKSMVKDASSKKFLVSNLTNYKMIDSRPVLEQYNELLGILGRFTQHKINMDESIQDSDKPKGNNVAGPLVVNMVEHNNSSRYTDNRGKRKHHDTKADPNKKYKVTCWKRGKPGHLKKDCKGGKVGNKANGSGTKGLDDDVAWLNVVNDNIGSAFMSTSELNDSILWHARLGHVYFKRMQDMSKDGLIPAFDMDTKKCKTYMLTKITKKPFQNVKRETKVLELIHNDLCDLHDTPFLWNKKCFVTFIDDASRTDRRGEYMDTLYFLSVGPSQGFWGEAMLTACYLLNKDCRAVVRLPDPKLKTLGKRGIKCIFVGYAEHSKAFRFFVIKPNESISINSIIESKDAIFDENRFSSVPKPSQRSLVIGTEDIGGSVIPEEVTEEVVQQPEPELKKIQKEYDSKEIWA